MWLIDLGCRDIVTKAWDCNAKGTPMFVATKKKKNEEVQKDVESLGPGPFWKCEGKYKEAKRTIVEGKDRFGQIWELNGGGSNQI